MEELEQALLSSAAEVIEDYPQDPRGPSCLVLGFSKAGRPLHTVVEGTTEVIVVTVYRPAQSEWIDWRKRRVHR